MTDETSPEWFKNAELRIPIDLGIRHREWDCVEAPEEDGDGFTTPSWYARNRINGDTRILNHSRFGFHMTPERFRWLVENNFPLTPGRGPWTNETIDSAMKEESE